MGSRWISSPLQKTGARRLHLAPYKRRGAGDHTGTIPGIDAGSGDCLQTSDPGSASTGSSLKGNQAFLKKKMPESLIK